MATPADNVRYVTYVAAKLRREPAAVIAYTLDTLAHWRSIGQSAPHRLDAWERLLRAAQSGGKPEMDALLHILESDDPADVRLCEFHPFPGVLTPEERRAMHRPCAYQH